MDDAAAGMDPAVAFSFLEPHPFVLGDIMDTAKLFPLEHDGEVIMCRTADDRKLLQEAFLLETEPAICDNFTTVQLRAIAAACVSYDLSALASEIEKIARKCDEIERP